LEELFTMRARTLLGAVAALFAAGALYAADLKSGPQVGSSRIPPFNPLHCNGKGEGGKACLV
jgi:hypothetical protein